MTFSILILFKLLSFFAPANKEIPKSIYDITVPAANGSTINFADYRGKKILIVNVPIVDDDNPQYAELEAMSKKYKGSLVVVGFLSPDFANPPGASKWPKRAHTYNVTFPLAAKVMVKGDDITPVYAWLSDKSYNGLMNSEVKWDFHKYLINEQGKLIAVFDPKVRVTSPTVIAAVENK